jgi:hypothetical protein
MSERAFRNEMAGIIEDVTMAIFDTINKERKSCTRMYHSNGRLIVKVAKQVGKLMRAARRKR